MALTNDPIPGACAAALLAAGAAAAAAVAAGVVPAVAGADAAGVVGIGEKMLVATTGVLDELLLPVALSDW
jgi:hypothetical protein